MCTPCLWVLLIFIILAYFDLVFKKSFYALRRLRDLFKLYQYYLCSQSLVAISTCWKWRILTILIMYHCILFYSCNIIVNITLWFVFNRLASKYSRVTGSPRDRCKSENLSCLSGRKIVDIRKSEHSRHSSVDSPRLPRTRHPVLPMWMRSDTRIDTKPAVGRAVPRARNYSKSLGPLCRFHQTDLLEEREKPLSHCSSSMDSDCVVAPLLIKQINVSHSRRLSATHGVSKPTRFVNVKQVRIYSYVGT